MNPVAYNRNYFIIEGKKVKIAAGAIHYFRIPRELWRDRIEKAKLSGLNTIETYLAWNAQEFEEGKFDFSGNLDLDAFFFECERAGMYIIARPGPYICSEWDNGGFPAWLNIKKGLKLRTYNKVYLKALKKYFDRCIPIINRHQCGKGGKVILVQLENEYLFPFRIGGAKYMKYLKDDMRKRGIYVPLSSCDHMAQPVKGVIQTYNGNRNFKQVAKVYKKAYPKNPFLVTEFWCGWFDIWGRSHNKKDVKEMTGHLKSIKEAGGMYIQYM
ncbi:MAG: beta-galactosidase, partial [Candidatus Firestonebacteria bacterium]